MKPQKLAVFFVMGLVGVFLLEYLIGGFHQASLIFTVAIWLGIAQGCIAIVAAAELAEGKWIHPLKKYLLGAAPFILFCGLLYSLMFAQWKHVYPSAVTDGHSQWFTGVAFCVGRNVALMFISFVFAVFYAKNSLAGNTLASRRLAVGYLFSFVITQSMVAFDIVMPLEYPWFSTLFGASFFVEALYLGLVMATFISLALFKKHGENIPADVKKAQYDTALLMHGFSILWTYMFFSQLIAIWYGNLPEEQSFFILRIFKGDHLNTTFVYLGVAVVLFLWTVPFVSLIFKRVKGNPKTVSFLGFVIITGVILEKTYILAPVAKINPIVLATEFLLVASIFFIQMKSNLCEEKAA